MRVLAPAAQPGTEGGCGWLLGGGWEGVNHVWTGTSSQSRAGMRRQKCGWGSRSRGGRATCVLHGASGQPAGRPGSRLFTPKLRLSWVQERESIPDPCSHPHCCVPGLVVGTGKPVMGQSLRGLLVFWGAFLAVVRWKHKVCRNKGYGGAVMILQGQNRPLRKKSLRARDQEVSWVLVTQEKRIRAKALRWNVPLRNSQKPVWEGKNNPV